MKVLVVAVLVAFVAVTQALTDEDKAKLQVLYKACVEESKVDEELIKKMRAGDFAKDDALKNYVYCMFKKIGFLNEKDEMVAEKVRAKASSVAEAEKVIEACKDVKGATPQDLAYNMYKCYNKTVEKVIEF